MRSWRLMISSLSINAVETSVGYADVFVVVREGESGPGPNDWEANITTTDRQRLAPGTYQLTGETADGHTLEGVALLRFSDGTRHLFRGDGPLSGVESALA